MPGSHGPDDIAGEWLDLDDIGALVGENHRGQRAGHVGGQIDDPGAGERSRCVSHDPSVLSRSGSISKPFAM